jgi:hypothetical protein
MYKQSSKVPNYENNRGPLLIIQKVNSLPRVNCGCIHDISVGILKGDVK